MSSNGSDAPVEECRRCKFFKSGNPLVTNATGICRRHGRFPVMVGMNARGPQISGYYAPHEPTDWCGDFERKVMLEISPGAHRPLDAR